MSNASNFPPCFTRIKKNLLSAFKTNQIPLMFFMKLFTKHCPHHCLVKSNLLLIVWHTRTLRQVCVSGEYLYSSGEEAEKNKVIERQERKMCGIKAERKLSNFKEKERSSSGKRQKRGLKVRWYDLEIWLGARPEIEQWKTQVFNGRQDEPRDLSCIYQKRRQTLWSAAVMYWQVMNVVLTNC